MSQTINEIPPLPPMERHGQIEVDTFCTGCFYNLHGQIVTIDPQLNFPICRCPECGRYQPAGNGVTAASVWMRRYASILLFIWVMIVCTGALAVSFAFLGLSTSSVEAYTYTESIPVGKNRWRFEQHLHPWQNAGNYDTNTNGIETMMWISAGSLVLGFIAGTLCVTLLWHWPRPRYLWTLLLPLAPLAGLAMIYHSIPNYDGIRMQCMLHAFSQTALQSLGILIGVRWGRSVSRTIIKTIVPPKPRQSLAFLWRADGLASPSPN